MTQDELFIRECVETGNVLRFYNWRKWRKTAKAVKEKYHNECVHCKERGILTRAEMVHHSFELKQYPQYALKETVVINGEKHINLIPLCNACHEKAHNRFVFDANKHKERFTNIERW